MLAVSGLLYAGASLIGQSAPHPVRMGLIYFANGVGMNVLAACAGWLLINLMLGRRVAFQRVFNIYALAAGITLLASWIQSFVIISELWKWWLIGTGLTRGLGLPRSRALIVVGISIALIVLLCSSGRSSRCCRPQAERRPVGGLPRQVRCESGGSVRLPMDA